MSIISNPDYRREIESNLFRLFEKHCNPAALEKTIRSDLVTNGNDRDEEYTKDLVRVSIKASTEKIHDVMLELLREDKRTVLSVDRESGDEAIYARHQKPPSRRGQLGSLASAAKSESIWKWEKSWRGLTDEVRDELEVAYLSAVKKGDVDPSIPVQVVGKLGPLPNPKLIAPLIDGIRGNHTGGRPNNDQLLGTIALILDEGQYLSQRKSWGIDPGTKTEFEQEGVKLVSSVFKLYEYGSRYFGRNDLVAQRLFEDARQFREQYRVDLKEIDSKNDLFDREIQEIDKPRSRGFRSLKRLKKTN